MILAFVGYKGSGKTLSIIRETLAYYKKGYAVYSNIKLIGIKYKDYDLKEIVKLHNNDEQVKNCVFIMDEAQLFVDSRRGMTGKSLCISYFISQTRKRNVHFLYSTQLNRMVDVRLRDNTDVKVICQKKKGRFYNTLELMNGKRHTFSFKGEEYYKYYDTEEKVKIEL
jgi:hypothetical protein